MTTHLLPGTLVTFSVRVALPVRNVKPEQLDQVLGAAEEGIRIQLEGLKVEPVVLLHSSFTISG